MSYFKSRFSNLILFWDTEEFLCPLFLPPTKRGGIFLEFILNIQE